MSRVPPINTRGGYQAWQACRMLRLRLCPVRAFTTKVGRLWHIAAQRIATNIKRAGALLPHGREGFVNLPRGAGVEHEQLLAKASCRLLRVAYYSPRFR